MPPGIVAGQGMEGCNCQAGLYPILNIAYMSQAARYEDMSGLLSSNDLTTATWLVQDFGMASCLHQESQDGKD